MYPSGIISAVYEIGKNVVRLRYEVRYRHLYREELTQRDRWTCEQVSRCMREDLNHLSTRGQVEVGQAVRALDAFEQFVGQHRPEDQERALASDYSGYRLRISEAWQPLQICTEECLREQPGLFPWYGLGAAVGRCFDELLDSNTSQGMTWGSRDGMQSMEGLVAAACAVPECYRRPGPLERVADSKYRLTDGPPVFAVAEVLNEGLSATDVLCAASHLIGQFERLEKAIRIAAEHELDGAGLYFHKSGKRDYVLHKQIPHLVSSEGVALLKETIAAPGQYVPGRKIIKRQRLQPETNLSQVRLRLPEPLRNCLDARPGRGKGGYR